MSRSLAHWLKISATIKMAIRLRACLENRSVASPSEKPASEDAQTRPRRRTERYVEEPSAEDKASGFRSRAQQEVFFKQALTPKRRDGNLGKHLKLSIFPGNVVQSKKQAI